MTLKKIDFGVILLQKWSRRKNIIYTSSYRFEKAI